MEQSYQKAKEWLKKEGFKPNSDSYQHHCDVHTPPINLMKAVIPDPEKKAITRIKEKIQETTHTIIESLDETAEEIYSDLAKKGDGLREKLTHKKDKKELKD